MNLQALPKLLNDAYTMFDSLQLSVTSLVVAGLLITVVLLFALREAASWFFKIDDVKKDIRKLRQVVVDMEAEVRLLQGLLTQNTKLASERAVVDRPVAAPMAAPKEKAPSTSAEAPSQPLKFPVTH